MAGSYLGILDRQTEPYVNEESWYRFLFYGLLFEPKLVFPDSFAFYSTHLAKHLSENQVGKSLFEQALSRGIVSPRFRSADQTFAGSLENLRRFGTLGRLPENHERLVKRLDSAIAKAPHGNIANPVESKSAHVTFRGLALNLLGRENPPQVLQRDSETLKIWEQSKRWRIDVLDEVLTTCEVTGVPLRRADWLRAVAQLYGWPKDNEFNDISEFDAYIPIQHRKSLTVFSRWVHECYQASGANELSVSCGFPNVAHEYAIIPFSLMAPSQTEGGSSGQYLSAAIERQVSFPQLHILRQMSPDTLVAIRSEYGTDYLQLLQSWREADESVTENHVGDAFELYADQIVKYLKRSGLEFRTQLELKIGRTFPKGILGSAGGLIGSLRGLHEIGQFLQVLESSFSLYRYIDAFPTFPRVSVPGRLDLVQELHVPKGS